MSRELFQEFDSLSRKGILSDVERRRFNYLTKMLPSGTVNPTRYDGGIEERAAIERRAVKRHEDIFLEYVTGKISEERYTEQLEIEKRADNQASGYWGSVTAQQYTGGDLSGGTSSEKAGGALVPVSFYETAVNTTRQFSELCDPANVTVIQEPGYQMRPKVVPAWDFGGWQAQEGFDVTQATQDPVPAYAKLSTGYYANVYLRFANEILQDSNAIDGVGIMGSVARGAGEAAGRFMASRLVAGSGSGHPNGQVLGVLNAVPDSHVSGALSYTLLNSIFHSVDRAYRNSSRARWLLSDGTLKAIRALVDDDHRPLLYMDSNGGENLFGKPLIVGPEVPTYNASPQVFGKICFGDFGHWVTHLSAMWVKRLDQRYADFGETALAIRWRYDGLYVDANQAVGDGKNPAITISTVNG